MANGPCRDEAGDVVGDVDLLCSKLTEENKQLKDLLIYILGFSTISVTKSQMDKLEEIKAYVKDLNAKRRDSKNP